MSPAALLPRASGWPGSRPGSQPASQPSIQPAAWPRYARAPTAGAGGGQSGTTSVRLAGALTHHGRRRRRQRRRQGASFCARPAGARWSARQPPPGCMGERAARGERNGAASSGGAKLEQRSLARSDFRSLSGATICAARCPRPASQRLLSSAGSERASESGAGRGRALTAPPARAPTNSTRERVAR